MVPCPNYKPQRSTEPKMKILWSFAIGTVFLLSVRAANVDASAITAVKSFFDSNVSASANISLGCLIEYCTTEAIECVVSITGCDKIILCGQKCFDEWDGDKTPEKFHVQNCSNKCTAGQSNKAYYNFMACITDHNCMAFPPLPNTCRAPNVHPLKNLTTKAVDGAWWAVKGYHPLYDCYPCQHLHFAPINASYYSFVSTYDTYTSEGSLLQVTLDVAIPVSVPGENISFSYRDGSGLLHHETWWLAWWTQQVTDRTS